MSKKYDKMKDPKKGIVYEGGFVLMENELSLYNLLGYSDDPTIRVTPMTIDIYRRLKMFRNNSDDHRYYGKAWISMERLAVEIAVNRKTVSKHLHILEKVGLINMRRFYHSGRRHYEFTFNGVMTEKEFKEEYPEIMAIYEEKLELIGKAVDKESEHWEEV